MFLQVEAGLLYKQQQLSLGVGGTGKVGECRRHICSCHSPGGLGAWEPLTVPIVATGFTRCTSFINLKINEAIHASECVLSWVKDEQVVKSDSFHSVVR